MLDPGAVKRLLSTPGGRTVIAVAVVQLVVLVRWLGVGLHADDVSWLSSLEAIAQGLEAPRPMRHLSWGLLHEIGHLPLDAAGWARGEPGGALQAVGTLIVAWVAWVAWCFARSLGHDERAASIAAVLASAAPATLLLSGLAGGAPRWLGTGTALLAVGIGAGALRGLVEEPPDLTVELRLLRRILLRRRLMATLVLFALGLAWHPSAAGVLAVAALLWGRAVRGGRRGWAMAGALWFACLLLAIGWVQLSGQGGMALTGARSLASALWAKPAVGLVHLSWDLPGLGWLLPPLPATVALAAGGIALAASLAWRPTRASGLVAVGGCVALIPEAAAIGYTSELASAWLLVHVQASLPLVLAAALAVAVPLARLRGRRSVALLGLVACLVGVRGWALLDARRDHARADAELQRLVGHDALAALGPGDGLTVRGTPEELSRPLKSLKWIPEVPEARRQLGIVPRPVAGYGLQTTTHGVPEGQDVAFWTMAAIRCELRLGLPRDREGPCRVPDLRAPGGRCTRDPTADPPGTGCPVPPAPVGPSASREPRARGWALLALLVLSLTGYLGRRRPAALETG